MKTHNYTVEPSVNNYELESFSEQKNSENNRDDLIFMIKKDGEVLGFAKYLPIRKNNTHSNALLLKRLICMDNSASQVLLKESLMHAWEIGYDAVFSSLNNSTLENVGFEEINAENYTLSFCNPIIYGISLSWDGLSSFLKCENSLVNSKM